MLSSIRKFSKSFLAKVFVAIIALPFARGMGDIFILKTKCIVEETKIKLVQKNLLAMLKNVKLNLMKLIN